MEIDKKYKFNPKEQEELILMARDVIRSDLYARKFYSDFDHRDLIDRKVIDFSNKILNGSYINDVFNEEFWDVNFNSFEEILQQFQKTSDELLADKQFYTN